MKTVFWFFSSARLWCAVSNLHYGDYCRLKQHYGTPGPFVTAMKSLSLCAPLWKGHSALLSLISWLVIAVWRSFAFPKKVNCFKFLWQGLFFGSPVVCIWWNCEKKLCFWHSTWFGPIAAMDLSMSVCFSVAERATKEEQKEKKAGPDMFFAWTNNEIWQLYFNTHVEFIAGGQGSQMLH